MATVTSGSPGLGRVRGSDLPYINVEKFGVGAGNSASVNAAAFVAAIAEAEDQDGAILIPGATYAVDTDAISIPGGVGVVAAPKAFLRFSGTGVGITVDHTISSEMYGRELRFPAIKLGSAVADPVWYSGTDTTSAGIKFVGLQYAHVYIPGVMGFYEGILFDAAAMNLVNNTVVLGFILNNQRGLHLKGNVGNFGANTNTFIGGRIGINSGYVAANCRKILIPNTEGNGNQFVSVNLEAGASELAVDCASGGNIWTNCRLEAGTAIPGFITFTATAHDNKFIGGLGSSSIVVGEWATMVSDAGLGNTFMFGSTISSKKLTLDMQADIPIKLGNGSAAPAYPIGSYGTDRMRFGYLGSPGARYYGTLMQEEIVQTTGTTLATSGNFHQLNYASPTTITGAISGGTDQTTAALLAVIDIVGNITLQHTAGPAAGAGKFVIKAAADKVLTANVPVLFVACNGNFYEV